ncbi:MAG: response regulator, partial [Candidatus Omnitrophica bacterium]|nr:response regulator [Candidatus Omnitrophota bacterium]
SLTKLLANSDFEVMVAKDSYQGTKFAYEERPDLIILDLMLPAGGGLSILKNIKLSVKTNQIPVVILTGLRDEELKKKIMSENENISAYVEKPVELDKLMGIINGVLTGKQS